MRLLIEIKVLSERTHPEIHTHANLSNDARRNAARKLKENVTKDDKERGGTPQRSVFVRVKIL